MKTIFEDILGGELIFKVTFCFVCGSLATYANDLQAAIPLRQGGELVPLSSLILIT